MDIWLLLFCYSEGSVVDRGSIAEAKTMSPDADWYSTNDGSGKQVMIFERAGSTRTLKNHYTYIPNDKYLMLALDWLHLQLQWLAGEESSPHSAPYSAQQIIFLAG